MAAEQQFLNAGIVSLDPLVTYTKRFGALPVGIAGAVPELFANRPSLHLVSASWFLHDSAVDEIASEIRRVSGILPQAHFIFLAASSYDAYRLASAGVPSFTCNSIIFIDEQVFRPMPPFDGTGYRYDAIYNARFETYKRHELAARIDNLALIYDRPLAGGVSAVEADVRKLLPTAHYLNHELGAGVYKNLNRVEVAQQLRLSRCGLCLSAEEGEMRVAMEYLLCGLPIVSTQSIGGRDRYFQPAYAIIAPDDPEAIAEAVKEMSRRRINKLAVRDHVGRILAHERQAFLKGLNAVARDVFGVSDVFGDMRAFIHAMPFIAPSEEWGRRRLEDVARALDEIPPRGAAPSRQAIAKSKVEDRYHKLFLEELALNGIPNEYEPGAGAANSSLLYILARLMRELPVQDVVELGSGQTSILIDRIRKAKHKAFEARTLEHDRNWIDRIGKKVDHRTIYAPLRKMDVAGHEIEFYEIANDLPQQIDFLLIDGPPASCPQTRFSRLGAATLVPLLGSDFVILIDDSEREGEQLLSALIAERLSSRHAGYRKKEFHGDKRQTVFAGGAFADAIDF